MELYCKSQEKYVIYRAYEDAGFSADSLNRPALKELLQDIRDGKITCVLAYKIDRHFEQDDRKKSDFEKLWHGAVFLCGTARRILLYPASSK